MGSCPDTNIDPSMLTTLLIALEIKFLLIIESNAWGI